jgi:hypothetical protein
MYLDESMSKNPLSTQRDDPVEVLAVESLFDNPNVILSGTRRGIINVHDIRHHPASPMGRPHSIKHPSAVSHIKYVRSNLITVAGLQGTLCNYDLRFTARRTTSNHTPPVLTYHHHQNSARFDLGFDIDRDSGIVAAAQDNPARSVKIFSLKTGEVLRTLQPMDSSGTIDDARVGAVRFVRDREDGGHRSLWVAKGTRMLRYAW